MLSGGGARGAYQVGVLQYLARQFPSAIPEVLTGVSAGAINAAFIAARQEPFVQKLDELAEMWSNLRIDQVFRVDHDLLWRAVRWGGRLMTGGKSPLKPAKSMVDTRPLRKCSSVSSTSAADGTIDGIQRQLARRMAARVRADGVELHDRAVDHLGADARRLRDAGVGAPATQEPDVLAARRSRDGVGRVAVLLSRHRGRRRRGTATAAFA